MTKQDYNYLNKYINGQGWQLWECYERPSIAKMDACESIKNRKDYKAGSFFIVSFSKFVFVACYRTINGNYAIVTPSNTKYYTIEDFIKYDQKIKAKEEAYRKRVIDLVYNSIVDYRCKDCADLFYNEIVEIVDCLGVTDRSWNCEWALRTSIETIKQVIRAWEASAENMDHAIELEHEYCQLQQM